MYFNDLKQSLEAVASAMPKCLDENNNFLPSAFGHWENAHDSGRWIEAVLMLEDCIGFDIPKKLERAMLFNFKALMSNPYGLLINDIELFENIDEVRLHYHSIREAFMALYTLVRYRNSKWAVRCGETLADTIDRRFFEKTLNDEEIRAVLGIPEVKKIFDRPIDPFEGKDCTDCTGRAIEAMLLFYKETGSEKVLAVLEKCVQLHRELNLRADGSAPEWMTCADHVGHNHSYLGTLRGLVLYGIEVGDNELVETVYKTYKNSVYKYNCSYSGFAPHDLARLSFPDGNGDPLGDQASCADVAYIAYLLASCGYTELYDDVQRLIRARLLRFQCNSGNEYGTWGITGGGLFVDGTTIDVFCLIASTLCKIYSDFVKEKETGLFIDLSFSKENEAVSVKAYRDEKQHLDIRMKCEKDLYVRLPEWCPLETVSVSTPYEIKEGYLFVSSEYCICNTVEILYSLPEKITEESTWRSGKKYRIFWCGDDILDHEQIDS